MKLSPWMPLVALASLLAAPACLVDPVDFTGKTCSSASDCPDGYRCDPVSGSCVASDAPATDGSVSSRDAAIAGDASLANDAAVEPTDADVVEPADADVVEKADGGKRPDGSLPTAFDGGPATDAAVVQPPDAGSGCKLDSDCKALGAYFCGPGGICQACNTDQKCGATCSACGLGSSCDGTSCRPCSTVLKCGPTCIQCDPGTSCDGLSCQPCNTSQKCGLTCLACELGNHCAQLPTGPFACAACNVPEFCGPSCVACPKLLPACGATGSCVECSATVPCATGVCLDERCVQCRVDTDCPQGGTGQFCDAANTCQSCKTAEHCGPTCIACFGPAPACNGAACVECLVDADCAGSARGPACCNSHCIANEIPKLAGFLPLSATPGTSLDLTLYGTGFNECSQVYIQGVPGTVSWSGNGSKISATVRVPATPGGHPVVVRNPGRGGGDSNPDDWSLGADLSVGQTTGVAYVPGADLVAIASSDRNMLETYDPATFTPAAVTIPLGAGPAFIAAGPKLLLLSESNSPEVRVYQDFPFGSYFPINAPSQSAVLDVDATTSQALIASSNPDQFQVLDLNSMQIVLSMPVTGAPLSELFGVGFDGLFPDSPFLSYSGSAGFPLPPFGFNQANPNPTRYQFAVNRLEHEVVQARGNFAEGYRFPSGSISGSVNIPMTGGLAMNATDFGARVLLLTMRGGPGALHFIDWSSKVSLGDVGAARSRFCTNGGKGQGVPDAIAIDPTRNRALVANSCNRTLEGYNLNILFVK
ncbi:MAG TPA: IPT/TIG domain-containing protein [Myxococcales bacterium]